MKPKTDDPLDHTTAAEKSVQHTMSISPTPTLHQRLAAIVETSDALVYALKAVRSLGLPEWCIGAGAIRSLVWDTLHGQENQLAAGDLDVAWFDAHASPEQDQQLEARLRALIPELRWEVTNQANVHHWFATALGQSVTPFNSLEAGVATWPEFATCIGVYLRKDDSIGVIAPHGLDDLFQLRVRHNAVRADANTYRQRIVAKRFSERWPMLTISDR